jgi:hypothetical protein
MKTTTSNKQVIYIFGNKDRPLSQIYNPNTKLYTPIKKITYPSSTIKKITYPSSTIKKMISSATIKKITSPSPPVINNISETDLFGNNEVIYPLHQLYPNNELHQLYPNNELHQLYPNNELHQLYPNNELHQLYPNNELHQLYPNNEVIYPLHQLYSNNSSGSGKGADPFLWLFPDPELLLDQYVPYLLHLYSQQTKQIIDEMQFINNDDSFDKTK